MTTVRSIKYKLFIDWSRTGSYVEETDHFVSAQGTMRLAAPESGITSPAGTEDSCSIMLQNVDRRYSPFYEAGPLYDDIKYGNAYNAPMYLQVSINGGANYYTIFTGVIKIPNENPPYPGSAGMVEIECRSRDELIMDNRQSTTLTSFQDLHDTYATEAEIITAFLEAAGLDSGDYDIDSGMFVIPWAWLDDESPLQDIWSLAAACGGRFYCGPDGIFRYENMYHWILSPHNTSQETLGKGQYAQSDGPRYDDRELFKSVTVVGSPRDLLPSGSTLWEADSTVVVPAGSTKTITAKMRQPAYAIDAVNYTAVTGGGIGLDDDITINMTQYAQRVELEIINANATYSAELVALNITGTPVSGRPSIEVTKDSSDTFWADYVSVRPGRTKSLRGNTYIQSEAQANALCEFLRDRFQRPRMSGKLRGVPGDPQRYLGERFTFSNTDVMTNTRQAFVIAIEWRLSKAGYAQDLTWLDAGNEADGTGLYPYDTYFIIGTNTLGSGAGSGHAHIFY